jgi:DNA-binding MurR/RpiR family transcriptional regulator
MDDNSLMRPRPFDARVARLGGSLGAAGQRVASFIAQHPAAALASSALELAASTGTSDATVIRTVQALGYPGLADLKQALVASLDRTATPADDMRRTLAELDEDATKALDTVLDAHAKALETLRSGTFRDQLAGALPVLHAADRIVVFGIGPSAALARYTAVLLARVGRRSKCLDAAGSMLADQLLDLRPGDVLLTLAYGRTYREVTGLFTEARRLRLPIVLVTETSDGPLIKSADVVLTIPRGTRQRVALHGGTLVGLEALVLALAAANRDDALAALERLNALRGAVGGPGHAKSTSGMTDPTGASNDE